MEYIPKERYLPVQDMAKDKKSVREIEELLGTSRHYTEIELNILEKIITNKLNAILLIQVLTIGVICYLLVR